MQCPIDGATLQMTERSGIEIDYCPQCRGVWLDRGELDKMIERSAAPVQPAVQPHLQQPAQPDYHQRPQQHQEYRHDGGYHKKHHKKENFLGDLFDF